MIVKTIVLIYARVLDVVILSSFVCSIVYFKKIIKNKSLLLFFFYTVVSLTVDIVGICDRPLGIFAINLFVPFELLIFYIFYLRIFTNGQNRTIIFFLLGIYLIIFCVLWVGHFRVEHTNLIKLLKLHTFTDVQIVSNTLIILPIILYYKSLFKTTPRNLNSDPVFIIMTGIIFGFSIMIPMQTMYVVLGSIDTETYLYFYIFNTLGYIFMHLFIMKAYTILK